MTVWQKISHRGFGKTRYATKGTLFLFRSFFDLPSRKLWTTNTRAGQCCSHSTGRCGRYVADRRIHRRNRNDAIGFTWSATAGTIDANGNYAAPSGPIQPGGFMPSMVLHLSRRIPRGNSRSSSLIMETIGFSQPELRGGVSGGPPCVHSTVPLMENRRDSKNCDADISSHDTDLFVFWRKCRRAEEWQRRVLRERQWARDGRRYLRSNTGQQRPNRLAHVCFGFIAYRGQRIPSLYPGVQW